MTWLDELRIRYESDRFFDEVFKMGIYKPAHDLGQVDVVLDVGACAGEFSFYIHDNAKRIYALEPDPVEYGELARNIEEFGLTKIKPFKMALFNTNEDTYLQLKGRGGHVTLPEYAQASIKTQTRTLNTFLKENNIEKVDILKIDVEQAEDAIFSAPDAGEALAKVKFICGEHGELDILREHGFKVEKVNRGWTATKI